jgi:hypothetical protein
MFITQNKQKTQTPWRESASDNTPVELPPLVGEVSVNFFG